MSGNCNWRGGSPLLSSPISASECFWADENQGWQNYHPYYYNQYANIGHQYEGNSVMPHYHQTEINNQCLAGGMTPPTPSGLGTEQTPLPLYSDPAAVTSSTLHSHLHPWMLLKRNTRPKSPSSPTTTTSSSNTVDKANLELREKLRGVHLKRPRTSFTIQQQCQLEQEFISNNYICKARRLQLSEDLGLEDKQIKIWFQNRRMKKKKEEAAANHLKLNNFDDPDSNQGSKTIEEDVENQVEYVDYYAPQTNITLDLSRVSGLNRDAAPLAELELQQLCKST